MHRLRFVSTLSLALALALAAGCKRGGHSAKFHIASSPPTTTVAGEPFRYDSVVRNDGGLAVQFVLSQAPTGMVVNDQSGRVTWTPTFADLGAHPVVIEARKADATVAQSFTLQVHQDVLLGVTYSPRGHTSLSTQQDLDDFYVPSAPWGRTISFHANWRDSVATAGELPALAQVALDAQGHYGVEVMVGFGWADGSGNADLRSESEPANDTWSNAETRAEFLELVESYAQLHRPSHLFLGNEVNAWYLASPSGWDDWITELAECSAAIHAVSPDTVVFTVFQYERLMGVGSHTGWSDTPQWDLVEELAASQVVDAIGFTTYPYFEYDDPADLPSDYYSQIALHWDGPVIFTELGWPRRESPPFPGSMQSQADFVDRFFELTEGMDLECAIYLFLHDFERPSDFPAFLEIGLETNGGGERPAYGRWVEAVSLRERR